MNQGRIEETLVNFLKINDRVRLESCMEPESLMLDQYAVEDSDARPVEIKIRYVRKNENTTMTNGVKQAECWFHADHDEAVRSRKAKKEGRAEGELEIIKAKYLLGCDGAHGWIRQQLDLSLEGKQTDYVCGVMGIIPLTNFPKLLLAAICKRGREG